MKKILFTINHVYLLFGTSLYVGVLWALHFFWYPSWETITLETVHDHFILPTEAATDFFTIVVPLMILTNIILIVQEWKTKYRWSTAFALFCFLVALYIGEFHIFPINDIIYSGVDSLERLRELFKQWMFLNDVRLVITTIMWLTLIYYFISKGNLAQRFLNEDQN